LHRIVDVGGGAGVMIAAILQAFPTTRGVLFDLPGAIAGGQERLRSLRLDARCDFEAGNFLEAVVAGGDAYVLSRVLHDWDDRDVVRILENCRRASQPGGKLLIVERVLDPVDPSKESILADISMMVINGGRERSLSEFKELLLQSGYEFEGVVPSGALVHIVSATAA
jgi:ubiquinone/menaquinone biosynthesis C-methylase UbiE